MGNLWDLTRRQTMPLQAVIDSPWHTTLGKKTNKGSACQTAPFINLQGRGKREREREGEGGGVCICVCVCERVTERERAVQFFDEIRPILLVLYVVAALLACLLVYLLYLIVHACGHVIGWLVLFICLYLVLAFAWSCSLVDRRLSL